jgi:hypothetical protein
MDHENPAERTAFCSSLSFFALDGTSTNVFGKLLPSSRAPNLQTETYATRTPGICAGETLWSVQILDTLEGSQLS